MSGMFPFITSRKVSGKKKRKDSDSCLGAETVALKDWIVIKFYIFKRDIIFKMKMNRRSYEMQSVVQIPSNSNLASFYFHSMAIKMIELLLSVAKCSDK